jgi:lipid A ethanolaminephosphotransferase
MPRSLSGSRRRGLRAPAEGRGLRSSSEALILLAAAYVSLTANRAFFQSTFESRHTAIADEPSFAIALFGLVLVANVVALAAITTRWTVKPVLSVYLVLSAIVSYFRDRYGTYVDPDMIRNVLATDRREVVELLDLTLLAHVALYGALPAVLLRWVHIRNVPVRSTILRRALMLLACAMTFVLAILAFGADLAAVVRNDRALRYRVTPLNAVYSAVRAHVDARRSTTDTLVPVGSDARPAPDLSTRALPEVLVLVVGETVRAANWGLTGYRRDTTPRLRELGVINFPTVIACGTNTETSLPCMFSAVGLRDYVESRIRTSEGLLHVLGRAGFAVRWLDNQSGCKGVCSGLPTESTACPDERCRDEVLVEALRRRLSDPEGHEIVVLHMLGSHGPAYSSRYPSAFRQFEPACASTTLTGCSRDSIVNAYDNSILYADTVLAEIVGLLKLGTRRASALIYVSDHGESLGEKGLYLHGVPYAVAPSEQTHVPMIWWVSDAFAAQSGIDLQCMRRRAAEPASHDHLFHSVLGLLRVETSVRDPSLDLTKACRSG